MFRIAFAFLSVVLFVSTASAKTSAICGGAFIKAATVSARPVSFDAQRLTCRSLKDGPRGYQLQCFGTPELPADATLTAWNWTRCLTDAGFRITPQGENDSIRITDLRHESGGVVCTLINSAKDDTRRLWSVKMKCFGPR